jgi:hypothetical protein
MWRGYLAAVLSIPSSPLVMAAEGKLNQGGTDE